MEYIGRIEKDQKLYKNKNGIVIFGAGKKLSQLLNKIEKRKVICICDNDLKKQRKEIEGITIVSPGYAFKFYNNATYIVYNQYCMEISRQLVLQGIEKIHLIRD